MDISEQRRDNRDFEVFIWAERLLLLLLLFLVVVVVVVVIVVVVL